MNPDTVDASFESFERTVQEAIERFPKNRICHALKEETAILADYHCLLVALFHQAYSAPYTYALAAYHCDWKHEHAKEFLLKHAETKLDHWRWILNDLAASGSPQPQIRTKSAHPACAAYIALNVQTAFGFPLGRLAVGVVLEGIASRFGTEYVHRLKTQLNLSGAHISYFQRRADCSTLYWSGMMGVLRGLQLTWTDWESMEDTARRAGELYKRIYDVIPAPREAPCPCRDHKARSAL